MAVRAVFAARTAFPANFETQTIKLPPLMKKIRYALVPLTLVLIGIAPLSQARGLSGERLDGSSDSAVGVAAEVRDGISLDEAVRRAESQFHARVVRTDVQDEDGRKVYVLKLLSDNGRVMTVRIDAATGRMR